MEVFGELVKLYGLPMAVLLGALATTGEVIIVLWRDLKASYEARLTDHQNEIKRGQIREEYFRTRWEETLALLEANANPPLADTVSKKSGR